MPKLLHRKRIPKPDDPDIIKRFTAAVEQGHGTKTAATLAGISEGTARDWMRYGNEELEAAHAGREQGSHAGFAQATNEAVARFVARNLGVVNESTAGPKGWLPAMTLLERRQPQDFARRFEAKVETTIDQRITFSVETLPPERQRALAELALKRLPAPDVVAGELVGDEQQITEPDTTSEP